VDDRLQEEPYVICRGLWNMPPMKVPAGEFFVAGDNRVMPMQQHTLGTVPGGKIIGGLLW